MRFYDHLPAFHTVPGTSLGKPYDGILAQDSITIAVFILSNSELNKALKKRIAILAQNAEKHAPILRCCLVAISLLMLVIALPCQVFFRKRIVSDKPTTIVAD